MPEKRKAEDNHEREAALREEAVFAKKQKEMAESLALSHSPAVKHPRREKSHKCIAVPQVKSKSWLDVLKAYAVHCENHGLEIDKMSGNLSFRSHGDAIKFFDAQAKAGHAFFIREFIGGQATDFYVFSCGNKQLYTGSLGTIKEQLKKASDKNPGDYQVKEGLELITKALAEKEAAGRLEAKPACPTTRMRGHLQNHRKEVTTESSSELITTLSR